MYNFIIAEPPHSDEDDDEYQPQDEYKQYQNFMKSNQ